MAQETPDNRTAVEIELHRADIRRRTQQVIEARQRIIRAAARMVVADRVGMAEFEVSARPGHSTALARFLGDAA